MLDLAILFFSLRAAVKVARLRWAAGIGVAAAALAAWLLLMLAGWRGRGPEQWGFSGVWLLLLLGPSGTIHPAMLGAWGAVIGRHATLARLAPASLVLAGFVFGTRHANQRSPLSDDYVRWNEAALAFLAVLVMVALEMMVFIVAGLGTEG